jgi:hypothetical protein
MDSVGEEVHNKSLHNDTFGELCRVRLVSTAQLQKKQTRIGIR